MVHFRQATALSLRAAEGDREQQGYARRNL
jgi:hypothetical protein